MRKIALVGLVVCVLAVASAGWSGEQTAAKKKPASPDAALPATAGYSREAGDRDEALVKDLVKILDETKSFDTFCVTASILCRVGAKARPAVPGIIRNAERLKILDKHLLSDKETKKSKVANDFLEGLGKLLPDKAEAGGAAEQSTFHDYSQVVKEYLECIKNRLPGKTDAASAAEQSTFHDYSSDSKPVADPGTPASTDLPPPSTALPPPEPIKDVPPPHGKVSPPDTNPTMPYADVPTPKADATPGPARGQSPATGDTQEILRRLDRIERRLTRIESRLTPGLTPQIVPRRPPQSVPYQ
jgi:hypothetical protein